MNWADLESPLNPEPAFLVEAPDGEKHLSEIDRQARFIGLMRMAAPRVEIWANANAGKRNPHFAKREGIRSGVFDMTVMFRPPLCAFVEFKGYDKRGRPGRLSDNQITFGNRMTELGIPAACFFSPYSAINWLRELGFPIREVTQ